MSESQYKHWRPISEAVYETEVDDAMSTVANADPANVTRGTMKLILNEFLKTRRIAADNAEYLRGREDGRTHAITELFIRASILSTEGERWRRYWEERDRPFDAGIFFDTAKLLETTADDLTAWAASRSKQERGQ